MKVVNGFQILSIDRVFTIVSYNIYYVIIYMIKIMIPINTYIYIYI